MYGVGFAIKGNMIFYFLSILPMLIRQYLLDKSFNSKKKEKK